MTTRPAGATVELVHADARTADLRLGQAAVLVLDPPYDDRELVRWSSTLPRPPSTLVFTDPRHLGTVVELFGPPAWLFVWDTANTWSVGPRRPVQQSKLCAWYGDLDRYDRDASTWGTAPPRRDHPTTRQTPLDGRRLTDVYRASLRWLHHPGAGNGSTGTERFSERVGPRALRHAKPVEWLRCLIANTAADDPGGLVVDPFAGSGAALVAAQELGRPALGVELDPELVEFARHRLAHPWLDALASPDQPSLWEAS